MCLASFEKGYYSTTAKTATASQKKHVSFFAMKLPLFGNKTVCDDDENNEISREQQYDLAAAAMRQQALPMGAPSHNATFNYGGGGMRRVQSANASRPRGAVDASTGMTNPLGMPQKSRSHSQESRHSRNAAYNVPPPPSEQLPIPQCKNTLLEIARTKSDQTDLRRMYDYATWNMYDRIVSARNKKRMSEVENTDDLDALINREGEKGSSASSSKHNNDKPSPVESSTANTSCDSSCASSPYQAATACKESGIIKSNGNYKTTDTQTKVHASTSNTTTTSSASATTATQAMSTTTLKQQQATATTSTTTNTNATQTSLQHKLRSIQKAMSSQDTADGTAATESTSTESEDSSGSRSGCDSPATFPGCMMTRGSSSRMLSEGSEDDHFIFQLDM